MQLGKLVVTLLLALSLGGFGCGLKEAVEDTGRVSTALKSELGLDAQVSFKSKNGYMVVAVRLTTPPSGDAATAKRNIVDVVNRNFRSKVDRVDVSF
jgi:hypothetical protein